MTDNFTPLDPDLHKAGDKAPDHDEELSSILAGKEMEAIPSRAERSEIKEVVEKTIEDKEVKKHVEVRPETIKIDEDLKKAGVIHTADIKFKDEKDFKLPIDITDEKIVQGLDKPITSSWRWLAELCVYLLKQAHLGLKTVHGKIVRVREK